MFLALSVHHYQTVLEHQYSAQHCQVRCALRGVYNNSTTNKATIVLPWVILASLHFCRVFRVEGHLHHYQAVLENSMTSKTAS